jgi:hypothetical protein
VCVVAPGVSDKCAEGASRRPPRALHNSFDPSHAPMLRMGSSLTKDVFVLSVMLCRWNVASERLHRHSFWRVIANT